MIAGAVYQALIGAEIFDAAEALNASAHDVSPHAAQEQQRVRAVAARVASSPGERQVVDASIRETIVPALKEFVFTKAAPEHDHWVGGAPDVPRNWDGAIRMQQASIDLMATQMHHPTFASASLFDRRFEAVIAEALDSQRQIATRDAEPGTAAAIQTLAAR